MLQCPGCGARNAAGSSFCVRCGSPLTGTATGLAAPAAPQGAGELLDQAAELYAAGKLDDATDACHAALDLDPDLPAARSLLGMIEEDRGHLAAALAEYEAVVRLAPERTAERERADRLRAILRAEAAPLTWQPTPDTDAHSSLLASPQARRWLPVVAAVTVGCLVLVVGGITMARRNRSAEQASPSFALQQPLPLPPLAAASPAPNAQESLVAEVPQGTDALAQPVGTPPQDQSANQPTAQQDVVDAHTGGHGRSVQSSSTGEPPLPPPTVVDSPPALSREPLKLPQPPASSAPATTPAPQPKPERMPSSTGKVRIWVGDEAPAEGAQGVSGDHTSAQPGTPYRPASGAAPTSAYTRPGGPRSQAGGAGATPAPATWNSVATNSQPATRSTRVPQTNPADVVRPTAAIQAESGQANAAAGARGVPPAAVPGTLGTAAGHAARGAPTTRPVAPASANTGTPSQPAARGTSPADRSPRAPTDRERSTAFPAPTTRRPGSTALDGTSAATLSPQGAAGTAPATARRMADAGGGASAAVRPTAGTLGTRAGATGVRGSGSVPGAQESSTASPGGAGAQESTALANTGGGRQTGSDDLRARAQQAWSSGRTGEARTMYRAAIAHYEAEARNNPERAAASRSAIESCRRALEALDSGQ